MAKYKGKTIVSVTFGPSVEGTDDTVKNIAVLLDDNSVFNVKYSSVLSTIAATQNQIAEATVRLSDLTALKTMISADLGL